LLLNHIHRFLVLTDYIGYSITIVRDNLYDNQAVFNIYCNIGIAGHGKNEEANCSSYFLTVRVTKNPDSELK